MNPTPPSLATGLRARATRRSLAGFILSGFLAALLGALLPAWGFHLRQDFFIMGSSFLAMALGVVAAAPATTVIGPQGVGRIITSASILAAAALALLAFASPPAPDEWRIGGLFLIGLALGLLNAGLLTAIGPVYEHDPAATVNLAGVFYVIGCLTITLLVAGTFFAYSVETILIVATALPLYFAWRFGRSRESVPATPPISHPADQTRGAMLLALLLFFQFGNEWSISGWLPLFLVSRLGISPDVALLLVAIYWIALLIGRLAMSALLPRLPHGRLLFGSAAAAMFGCLMLLFTDKISGALTGLVLIAGGFAPIYPLVAEKIGHRFTGYHPGLFHGLFSLALAGGLIMPAMAGFLAGWLGSGWIMAVPMIGTAMVVVLLLIIWLESKIGG